MSPEVHRVLHGHAKEDYRHYKRITDIHVNLLDLIRNNKPEIYETVIEKMIGYYEDEADKAKVKMDDHAIHFNV